MQGAGEGPAPPDEPHAGLAQDLAALAHAQRLRLLPLLTRPRYGEELAAALGTSRQSALKHIEKLRERGFVRALHGRRVTGPVVEYQVVPQRLFALGMALGSLGGLEPEGGPARRLAEPTMHFPPGHRAPAPPPAPPACRLLVASGPAAGATVALEGDGPRWTLGRDEDRDLRLAADPYVSGRHAEIQRDLLGFHLVDAHSANGTMLNFVRLPRGGRVPLQPGDVVGVGHTALVFQRG